MIYDAFFQGAGYISKARYLGRWEEPQRLPLLMSLLGLYHLCKRRKELPSSTLSSQSAAPDLWSQIKTWSLVQSQTFLLTLTATSSDPQFSPILSLKCFLLPVTRATFPPLRLCLHLWIYPFLHVTGNWICDNRDEVLRVGLSSEVVRTVTHFPLWETFPRSPHTPIAPPSLPAGKRDNPPSLGEDAKHFKWADLGCLESKCCLNGNYLFSLGKGNSPRPKRPTEQVQPTATNFKAGAGFVMENTQQQSYHPCESCTNAIQAVAPIHTIKYTTTFFHFGCIFFSSSSKRFTIFFLAFVYWSEKQCRIPEFIH